MRSPLLPTAVLLLLAAPAPAQQPETGAQKVERIEGCVLKSGKLDQRAKDRHQEDRYTLTGVPVEVAVWDDDGVKTTRKETLTVVLVASPRQARLMRLGFQPSNLEVCDAGADGIVSPRKGGELHPDASCKAFGAWSAARSLEGAFMPFWPTWVADGKKRTAAYEAAMARDDKKQMESLLSEGQGYAQKLVAEHGQAVFDDALKAAAEGIRNDPRCR